jgi:glycosyltransferase involved in cell wall biosynthesis
MLEELYQMRREFDIVHFHLDYLHFPFSRHMGLRQVTTLHGRLDIPDLVPLYREFNDMPVVSISLRQRDPLPMACWAGNVYHGLPHNLLKFHDGPGKYLAFIGRISPEKRPDRAIEIARRVGIPLKLAAKVDKANEDYFEHVIHPLLNQPGVEFVGEIGDAEKGDFLGNAIASLAPIDWPEPFGLNMIEAMACGTPTIAFNAGSVPELIEDGVSGLIVHSVDEAVEAVPKAQAMSRRACRNAFEKRFTARRMAKEYLAVYEHLLAVNSYGAAELGDDQDSELMNEDVA